MECIVMHTNIQIEFLSLNLALYFSVLLIKHFYSSRKLFLSLNHYCEAET